MSESTPLKPPAQNKPPMWSEPGADPECPRCGGNGSIMLSEAGPSVWGEDTFCDVDRLIVCPECRGMP